MAAVEGGDGDGEAWKVREELRERGGLRGPVARERRVLLAAAVAEGRVDWEAEEEVEEDEGGVMPEARGGVEEGMDEGGIERLVGSVLYCCACA